jgi:hypothetical protein
MFLTFRSSNVCIRIRSIWIITICIRLSPPRFDLFGAKLRTYWFGSGCVWCKSVWLFDVGPRLRASWIFDVPTELRATRQRNLSLRNVASWFEDVCIGLFSSGVNCLDTEFRAPRICDVYIRFHTSGFHYFCQKHVKHWLSLLCFRTDSLWLCTFRI